MTSTRLAASSIAAPAFAFAMALSFGGIAGAQTTSKPAAKPAAKPTAKAAKKAALPKPEPVVFVPAAATPEQIDAAERVYYGKYECESSQAVQIVASDKYPAYVDVKHLKSDYLMKPVLSSTGAIRLEDTRGETLMVQIANKSMLLNVKTGHRVVDDCISPKQRELIAAAAAAKAAGGGSESSGGIFGSQASTAAK